MIIFVIILNKYNTGSYSDVNDSVYRSWSNRNYENASDTNKDNLKYILQWTKPYTIPFVHMRSGRETFLQRDCFYTNCFVTSDRNLLEDITKFNIIAFHGPEVIALKKSEFPQRRALNQKYVFASIESSDYYPVCHKRFDNYFNWTWTYKLNSDEPYGYISIRDINLNVIGPKLEMQWLNIDDMDEISEDLRNKLASKTKAAAWVVSNCNARSSRQDFVKNLSIELNKYGLVIDIYGKCGSFKCPEKNMTECLKKIEKYYYFYLSFENSFSEDYVTEKLLHALQNNVVPIVFGAANYTRFMPEGIYLNARELGAEKLAATMKEIIDEPKKYYNFFRWKNHYSYYDRSDSPETDDYCRFCAMANDEELMKTISVYQDFKKWWTPPGRC